MVLLFGWSCSAKKNMTSELSNQFCLSDSLQRMVALDTIRFRPVTQEIKLTGKVTFNEEKVSKVYPVVGGTVLDVLVQVGDRVNKGQALAIIKSSEIATYEQQLIAARSNLTMAQKNLEVQQDLYKSGLVPQKEIIGAEKDVQIAESELKRVREIFQIMGIEKGSDYFVKSPVEGYIVEKKLTEGMLLRADFNSEIFVVSPLRDVWVMANVYENDIAKVKEGAQANITTISYPDRVIVGTIDKVYNVIDPLTRVMKVRIRLPNDDLSLKPEMYANISVKYEQGLEMAAVPSRCVIFDKNRYFLMVYHDKCNIESRPVEVVTEANGYTYISTAVKDGERVLGKYQLLVYEALND